MLLSCMDLLRLVESCEAVHDVGLAMWQSEGLRRLAKESKESTEDPGVLFCSGSLLAQGDLEDPKNPAFVSKMALRDRAVTEPAALLAGYEGGSELR
jgi:hypothetical protein